MNFFGVGVLEVVLVAVVAVIVLGPERMPEAAVQLARAIRHLRGFATSATSQLRSELEELTRDYEEVRRELQDFRQSVRKDMTAVTEQVSRTLLDAQPLIEPGGEPPPEQPQPEGPAKS